MARGSLSIEDRNRALEEAADEAAGQVLKDNRDQVLLLSLEQIRSRTQTSVFREHLTAIEQRGLLRRSEEALPTREALSERHARFAGLTRPELAVLIAYTKLDLSQRLETSAVVSDPYLVERYLVPYFPPSISQRFAGRDPGPSAAPRIGGDPTRQRTGRYDGRDFRLQPGARFRRSAPSRWCAPG